MEIGPYVAIGIAVLGFVFGVGRWTMGVDADRKSLKELAKRIEGKLDEILNILTGHKTFSPGSPIQLTELGEKIAANLQAERIVEDLVPNLLERVEGKEAYDVQEICTSFFRDEYAPPPETETLIKECAFENGVDWEQVMMVFAILSRDLLLRPTDEDPQ